MKDSIPISKIFNYTISRVFGLLISILFLFAGVLSAQNQGTVQGTVYDSDNNPLPGANVLLQGTQTGTSTNPEFITTHLRKYLMWRMSKEIDSHHSV